MSDPSKFIPLISSASIACDGGSSAIMLRNPRGGVLISPGEVRAARVAAVRFDFQDGSREGGRGLGFNVYREIQVIGKPAGR